MPDEEANASEDWPVDGPSGDELVGGTPVERLTAAETSSYEASEKLSAMMGGGLRSLTRLHSRQISQYEQLLELRKNLQAKLADIEAAITALDENPQIERVMRLVSRALY
jgi:hypothetical protein